MRIFHRLLRFFCMVTLFFFCWTYLSFWQVAAYAVENKGAGVRASAVNAASKAPDSSGSRFEKALESIRESVSRAEEEEKEAKAQGSAAEIEAVRTKEAEVANLDVELQKEFTATEKNIKDSNLPREILDRHAKFVKHYNDNLAELKSNLNAIENAKTKAQLNAALQKAKSHLEKVKAPKKHVPLDPNKMPYRTVKAKERAPRLKKEEFEKEFGPSNNGKGKVAGAQARDALFGMQDKGLESWIRDRASLRKPVQLAFNGIVGDIPLAFGSELSWKNDELKNSLPDFSFYQTVLAIDNQPEGILLAQVASNPPTSADLAETVEVQFTAEIRAKAQELGYNPVKIYEWVRNNVEFVPTYGSIQGANMCLQTRQCNDFDTASLLIALLRASNISAHYVSGTIEIPIEKVMNWAGGFTDPLAALNFVTSGGIPVKGITSGGKIITARIEHVWVEAWVDYIPSRGAVHRQGDTWIPLDASFKQYVHKTGLDIRQIAGFDPTAFGNSLLNSGASDPSTGSITGINTALVQSKIDEVRTALETHINAMQNPTVGDIIGGKEIITQVMGLLPATLPYKTVLSGTKYAEIPDSLRHKLAISIVDPLDFDQTQSLSAAFSTAYLAGKRVTITYMPATAADAQILDSNGYYNVRPYLVNLKPVLNIDGVPAASGLGAGMGTMQDLSVAFTMPGGSSDMVTHEIAVSTYASIGLDLQRVPKWLLDQRKAKLATAIDQLGQQDVNMDDVIGETLNLHNLAYFSQVESGNRSIALGKVAYSKQPAEMLSTLAPTVGYLYGMPYTISGLGMGVDVRRYLMTAVSLSGNGSAEKTFMMASGASSSACEHAVFEELHQNTQGISAVKVIGFANQQGIPIYTIDSTNSATILPRLRISSETMSDIRNALAAGKRVTIPEQSVHYYDWSGDGYIIVDPDTGAGAYMISGGLAGGGTAQKNDPVASSFWDILTKALTAYANSAVGVAVAKLFSEYSGMAILKSSAGSLGLMISELAAMNDMEESTHTPWKVGAAGATVVLLSYLQSYIAAETIAMGIVGGPVGIICAILFLVILSVLISLFQQMVLEDIKNAWLRIIRKLAEYAYKRYTISLLMPDNVAYA